MDTKNYYAVFNGKVYKNKTLTKDWFCMSYEPENFNPNEESTSLTKDEFKNIVLGIKYIQDDKAKELIQESWRNVDLTFEFNGHKCKADKTIKDITKNKDAMLDFVRNLPSHKGKYGENKHLCLMYGKLYYIDDPVLTLFPSAWLYDIKTKGCRTTGILADARPIIDIETGEYM